ncbi:MAG: DUF3604 domain-containing protein [Planctomycetota bacterium]|nr:DUF3604 domain-containing protein [Planctomycetota bacterium]
MGTGDDRRAEAQVTNGPFRVYEMTDVEIRIGNLPRMTAGAFLDLRFPLSWTIGVDPSFTKQLQSSDPDGPDYVCAESGDGGAQFAIEISRADFLTGRPRSRHGRNIRVRVVGGEIKEGGEVWIDLRNTRASKLAEEEEIYIAVNGERIEDLPTLATIPGEGYLIRMIAPSSVPPGRTFLLRIVSLDRFFNLSRTCHRGVRIFDDRGKLIHDGLDFQGSTAVPIVAEGPGIRRYGIPAPGRETVDLSALGGQKIGGPGPADDIWSNPVKVADGCRGPYWGDMHIHSRFSADAAGRYPFRYARDVSCLDFAAVTDHDSSLSREAWDIHKRAVLEERRAGTFATILAFESSGGYPDGHHNVYYFSDEGRPFGNGEVAKLSDILPHLDPSEAIVIPHHTGISFNKDAPPAESAAVDFSLPDRDMRSAIEIYSHHGQSELYDPYHFLAYEINRAHSEGRRVNFSVRGPFYAQDAWLAGKRWAAVASSDDHLGQGGKPYQGLTAVWVDELNHRAILEAIRSRSTYATTGERILLDFSINGTGMGGVVRVAPGGGLDISVEAHGTSPIMWIEIVRLDFRLRTFNIACREFPMAFDHSVKIRETFEGERMYYVRLAQKDLIEHRRPMAWSSPIWVETSASRKSYAVPDAGT